MSLRLADIRDIVLLTGAVVLAAMLVAPLPPLGVPLAAFGLVTLAYRFRDNSAWIAAVLATGVVALVAWPAWAFALLAVAPVLVTAGPVAAKLLRNRPALLVAAIIAIVVTVVQFAGIAAEAAVAGKSLLAYMDAQMTQSVDAFVKSAGSSGRSLSLDPATLRTEVLMLMPGFLVDMALLTGLLGTAAAAAAGRRSNVAVNRLPDVTTLEISTYALIPVIAGLAALAFQAFAQGTMAMVLGIIGGNLLVVGVPLLTIQGLGILLFWLKRWEIPRGARIALAIAACVLEPFVPLMTLAGLVDTWLNLRRLPRDGVDPQAEQR
jgi:uncharacterized protein YybS (DUF2232 family)